MPAGGRNQGMRIEILEEQLARAQSRLDLLDQQFENLDELLKKHISAGESHTTRITIVEQQLNVIVDLKAAMEVVQEVRRELVGMERDIHSLQEWKSSQTREREEAARRWWSFGPNIAAAAITGVLGFLITMVNVVLTFTLNYWLRNP